MTRGRSKNREANKVDQVDGSEAVKSTRRYLIFIVGVRRHAYSTVRRPSEAFPHVRALGWGVLAAVVVGWGHSQYEPERVLAV